MASGMAKGEESWSWRSIVNSERIAVKNHDTANLCTIGHSELSLESQGRVKSRQKSEANPRCVVNSLSSSFPQSYCPRCIPNLVLLGWRSLKSASISLVIPLRGFLVIRRYIPIQLLRIESKRSFGDKSRH